MLRACRPARRSAGRRCLSRRSTPSFPPTAGGWEYLDGARVVKVPLAGGAPVTICDSCTGYLLLLGWRRHRPLPTAPPSNPNSRVLMAVSARGGTPYEIARPDSGSTEAFQARCWYLEPGPCCSRRSTDRQPPRGVESRYPRDHQVRSAGIQSTLGSGRIRDPGQLGRQPDRPAF